MDEAMDTALVQSSRDSSPKRGKASKTTRVYVMFLLSFTPPCKCVCVTCECVYFRERGVVLPPSVRWWCFPPSALPALLLNYCKLNVFKRCRLSHRSVAHALFTLLLLLARSHSISLPPSLYFSARSLTDSPSPPPLHPLLSYHPPPTSQATCECRATASQRCVPCATSGRGFLQACIRWSSQMGKTIYSALKTTPPSPAIFPSIFLPSSQPTFQ